MSFNSYEEFSQRMTGILSSGSVLELSDWHEQQLTELFSGMHKGTLIDFLNIWYRSQQIEDVREDELSWIAEHLGLTVETRIWFAGG